MSYFGTEQATPLQWFTMSNELYDIEFFKDANVEKALDIFSDDIFDLIEEIPPYQPVDHKLEENEQLVKNETALVVRNTPPSVVTTNIKKEPSGKRKAYEQDPFSDEESEKRRKNAIKAHESRQKKKSLEQLKEEELKKSRQENSELSFENIKLIHEKENWERERKEFVAREEAWAEREKGWVKEKEWMTEREIIWLRKIAQGDREREMFLKQIMDLMRGKKECVVLQLNSN